MDNDQVQVIILAGGKGTRLQTVINDVPKPMAPIGTKPFLEYLINNCKKFGFNNILLSTGYKSFIISDYFGDGKRLEVNIDYSREESPLGTAGAIKQAILNSKYNRFLCINGDTYFGINLNLFTQQSEDLFDKDINAIALLCLKITKNSERYGSVILGHDRKILSFSEKKNKKSALISSGIYYLKRDIVNFIQDGPQSIETDVFPLLSNKNSLFGIKHEGQFIDIGIPNDYFFACENLESWTQNAIL